MTTTRNDNERVNDADPCPQRGTTADKENGADCAAC